MYKLFVYKHLNGKCLIFQKSEFGPAPGTLNIDLYMHRRKQIIYYSVILLRSIICLGLLNV